MTKSLLYGDVPPDLAETPPGSVQVSPLVPGAGNLETLAPESCDGLVMRAPSNTIERRHDIALAMRALRPGAPFTILAANDKGGSRLKRELEAFGVETDDSPKRHHRICTGKRPAALTGIDEAVEEGALRFREELGIATQPGIFSWDRVDVGSTVLLEVMPKLSGRVGDFGCGYGLLSASVLRSETVTAVTGYDVDRRAVAAARMNIADPRFSAVWVDIAGKGVGVTGLDAIVMNPPFHRAGVEDQSLGVTMIQRAAEALRTGGTLWLTANRHLPYEAVLKACFKRVRLVKEAEGFKVFEALK